MGYRKKNVTRFHTDRRQYSCKPILDMKCASLSQSYTEIDKILCHMALRKQSTNSSYDEVLCITQNFWGHKKN